MMMTAQHFQVTFKFNPEHCDNRPVHEENRALAFAEAFEIRVLGMIKPCSASGWI